MLSTIFKGTGSVYQNFQATILYAMRFGFKPDLSHDQLGAICDVNRLASMHRAAMSYLEDKTSQTYGWTAEYNRFVVGNSDK